MTEPRYPHSPGWRTGPNSATSREAALVATVSAAPLKHRILSLIGEAPGTPEELAARLAADGQVVLLNTVRARVSDLHSQGRLRPTGTYGLGESGKARTIRWRLADAEELALFAARQAVESEKSGGDA